MPILAASMPIFTSVYIPSAGLPTHHSLPTTYYSSHYSLLTAYCLLLTTYCLLLTNHDSLLTTYYSLLITLIDASLCVREAASDALLYRIVYAYGQTGMLWHPLCTRKVDL